MHSCELNFLYLVVNYFIFKIKNNKECNYKGMQEFLLHMHIDVE